MKKSKGFTLATLVELILVAMLAGFSAIFIIPVVEKGVDNQEVNVIQYEPQQEERNLEIVIVRD